MERYLISLLPGGHGEYTYNITDYYILSSPGKYRFEINYNFDDDKNTKYSVTVDFEIYYISFSDKDIQKTYVYKRIIGYYASYSNSVRK